MAANSNPDPPAQEDDAVDVNSDSEVSPVTRTSLATSPAAVQQLSEAAAAFAKPPKPLNLDLLSYRNLTRAPTPPLSPSSDESGSAGSPSSSNASPDMSRRSSSSTDSRGTKVYTRRAFASAAAMSPAGSRSERSQMSFEEFLSQPKSVGSPSAKVRQLTQLVI